MTGEITLRGRVMPIGGLKEKLLAAHRSGITTVIVPKENRKDLREVPRRVLKATRVVLVDHMDEVLREALCLPSAGQAVRRRRASAGSTARASSSSSPAGPAPERGRRRRGTGQTAGLRARRAATSVKHWHLTPTSAPA